MTTTMILLQPSKEDLQYQYHRGMYERTFGGWRRFLVSVGEADPSSIRPKGSYYSYGTIPKKEIRDYFDKVFPQHPPYPSGDMLRYPDYKYTKRAIEYYYSPNPMYNLLRDIRDIDEDAEPPHFYSRNDYLETYNIIKNHIGKHPTSKEITYWVSRGIGYVGFYAFKHRYGSWKKFLRSMGYDAKDIPRLTKRWDKNAILNKFQELSKELGHTPSHLEIRNYSEGFAQGIWKVYGGYQKFCLVNNINMHATKRCQHCNKEFKVYLITTSRNRRFCSKTCASRQYYKDHPEWFERAYKYSRKHYLKNNPEHYIKCANCGKKVLTTSKTRIKYCGQSCAIEYRNERLKRETKDPVFAKETKRRRNMARKYSRASYQRHKDDPEWRRRLTARNRRSYIKRMESKK
jgi:hypothetical protein